MASLAEPLVALIDPVDGVGRAVQARRWVLPLLALAACVCASGVAFSLRWNPEPVVVGEIEAAGEMTTTTEQELASKIQTKARIALVGGVAKGALGMPLAVLLVAAALKVLSWLLSRRATFSRCFAAAAIAFLPIALYHAIFTIAALRAGELSASQVGTLIPCSLAALAKGAPKLARVWSAFDFFNVWAGVLLGLGFASASGMNRGKGVATGVLLYAAYAAVFLVALPGLSGGHR